ncbi:hypothetical protein B0O99DRAFT_604530 [Bisporella sp. PMI_857]|nr:hypothetical protein B0O99DRAFT_604530 [Bisporella sp. PMI_857]
MPSTSDESPQYAQIGKLRGFLPLNIEDASPLTLHGQGHLNALIRSRSSSSLQGLGTPRRPSSYRAARELADEEGSGHFGDSDDNYSLNEERRLSLILNGPQMRSQRLIGNSNPRYRWERYWKTEEELKTFKKPVRKYYERTNSLIQQYIYIDRLLDSSLPHDLLNEYANTTTANGVEVPPTITEEPPTSRSASITPSNSVPELHGLNSLPKKVKRTPREIYKVPNETSPLLSDEDDDDYDGPKPEIPGMEDDTVESSDRIVKVAIYVNLAANAILLTGKIAVIVLTNSLSVLASLVDAALDFLSTAIVWTTTRLIERQDQYNYPVGRRRLEPIGVLVFAVIMVTSFFQVALECFNRLNSGDHSIIQLGLPAIVIMSATVFIKALCWFWCRLVKNSSVQALAQDAMTDIIFNIFSIIFPLGKFYPLSSLNDS